MERPIYSGSEALKKAVNFYYFLEALFLENKISFKDALRSNDVSLWELVGPTLVLYRFPKFWLVMGWRRSIEIFQDLYVQPLFLRMISIYKKVRSETRIKNTVKSNQKFDIAKGERRLLFLAFNSSFFHQVQAPIVQKLRKQAGYKIFVLTNTEWGKSTKKFFLSVKCAYLSIVILV